jgi:hypothetical protein
MPIQRMSRHRPSVALELCWPWGPLWATWWVFPRVQRRTRSPLRPRAWGVAVLPVPVACTHRSQPMGPFGVKDMGAPEVKFLDRCQIHGSEGVLQVHVRRSRMRVRGAKMIRHRRSPATVNDAGQALAGQESSDPVRATPPTTRNPQPVGSGGSTVARLKLKGIDGMAPQGVEYAA